MKKFFVVVMLALSTTLSHAARWAEQSSFDAPEFPNRIVDQIDLDSFKNSNGFGFYTIRRIITVKSTGETTVKINYMEMECKTTAFRVIGEDTWYISNNKSSLVYQMVCKK